jgi:hypothetical protein
MRPSWYQSKKSSDKASYGSPLDDPDEEDSDDE